jgi:hypothetical protein
VSAFTDFLKQQRDLAHLLLSDPWLNDVNIVMRHELLTDSALARLPDKTLAAEVLCYITPRNQGAGRKGCGVIVERPEFSVESPNVTGPQGDIVCEFLVLSDRGLNEAPNSGTLRSASSVAQRILDLLHLHADDGIGTYRADGRAIQAAADYEPLDGYRVRLRCTTKRQQTARVARVTTSVNSGNCTLSCATTDARIYWTAGGQDADGNWLEPGPPAPTNTGGGATLYESPFAVASGQIVRCAAFKADLNQSPITRLTVT